MLTSLNGFLGWDLVTTTGEKAKTDDFFIDDSFWITRYIVADLGRVIPDRLILVVPGSIGSIDYKNKELELTITGDEIKNAPDIRTDRPVSRRMEKELYDYYNRVPYWKIAARAHGDTALDPGMYEKNNDPLDDGDPSLRSLTVLERYDIVCSDGPGGKLSDMVADTEKWQIPFIEIKTDDSKKIFFPTDEISDIDANKKEIFINVTCEILNSIPAHAGIGKSEEEYISEVNMILHKHLRERRTR